MEASMEQILLAREARVRTQKQILSHWGVPLICLTMNIPGPVKDSPLIRFGFREGCSRLEALLESCRFPVLEKKKEYALTGCQGFWAVDADPWKLKSLCTRLEDRDDLGRLLDLDVITVTGGKVSREELGLSPRRCLLCQNLATICSRSRAHPLKDLQDAANGILLRTQQEQRLEKIGEYALRALLLEVATTPKPGLVDLRNTGSHRDMDVVCFLQSAAALSPYFTRCARMGLEHRGVNPEVLFSHLRAEGMLAEHTMFTATHGINTHKGAIFLLGILCAAAGYADSLTEERLFSLCSAMTRGICQECDENAGTYGQQLYQKYGVTGIRGQAEAGFPAIRLALPLLQQGVAQGMSLTDAGSCALLTILLHIDDTSFLHRDTGGQCREALAEVRKVLVSSPFPQRSDREALDDLFIRLGLSPGGSADLLAGAYFAYFLLIDTGNISGIMESESKTEKEY